jgi:phage protein D
MRDSQIAEQIASEYGFTPDVQKTEPVKFQEIQNDETDAQFLLRLARKHGFYVNVMEGVLSFRRETYEDSGIQLVYRGDKASGVLHSFQVSYDQQFMGGTVTGSYLDPVTLEEYSVKSQDSEDDLTKKGKSKGLTEQGLLMAAELASLDGGRPETFMMEEGRLDTREEANTMVETWAQRLQWMIEGSASSFANENLHAGTMVEIVGGGANGGMYLVPWVRHELKGFGNSKVSAYSMRLGLRRSWAGKPRESGGIQGATV